MENAINPLDVIYGGATNAIDAPLPQIDLEKMKFNKVQLSSKNNIVDKKALRRVQLQTLDTIERSLQCTFGPTASSTVILTGSDATTLVANYSKDGRKCLKHLLFSDAIELSIRTQLDDIVSHVDQEVGDGTTSATLLSAEVFKKLCAMEEEKGKARYPYKVSRDFKAAVKLIQDEIITNRQEPTLENIKRIAFVSTNGNEEVADKIYNIYKEFGLDCFIDVGTSNTEDDQIKIFDGLTIDEGYSDAAYINTQQGKSVIRNANVYVFEDPIDTPEMGAFLDKIIEDNIFRPIMENDDENIVPTVIMSPKISRDMSQTITRLVEYLYKYDSNNDYGGKPPILIVTNLGAYLEQYLDIGRLCGATFIKKYIDPAIQKQDIEKGVAPTPETIHKFAGKCEQVEAGVRTTKFIVPDKMYEKDENGIVKVDDNGDPIPTPVLTNLFKFLEGQLIDAKQNNEDDRTIYRLKKRLQSLKANMVELNVGGITIADRDETKDLVEDAVKSCRSAANVGVGYGANFEGFYACYKIINGEHYEELSDGIKEMLFVILSAYSEVLSILYGSTDGVTKDIVDLLKISVEVEKSPYNVVSEAFDKSVLTSIDTDIKILDAISKIVTLMFTTEQCYVQVPALNHYSD